jgi:UDP-N-acetylmuramoyl-tripeptide--D-alanyl-D-alanine ligase
MEQDSIEQLYSIYRKHPVICTDTRKITAGSIYFALRGSNFNGNEFVAAALEGGCAFAVTEDPAFSKNKKCLVVEDSLKTLQDLARHHRSLLTIPVIAITGSNGKTTTKELLKSVLSKKFRAFATEGNLNNHIGVPISILSITDENDIAVIEMGANHPGEIAMLCDIARPEYGIITNIGRAHLDGFGGPEGVIKAKSELYQYIEKHSGKIFVNRDNTLLTGLIKSADTYTYGTSGLCNCLGRSVAAHPFISFRWKTNKEEEMLETKEVIQTQLTGLYNLENILCAVCVGSYFGVTTSDINEAIASFVPGNNRSQVIETKRNTVILDAYNANPTSMKAALENFASLEGKEKVVILGDMLELGSYSLQEHQEIVNLLNEKGITHCILVGEHFGAALKGIKTKKNIEFFPSAKEAIKKFKPAASKLKGYKILIKGSRSVKLEDLAALF